MNLTEIKKVKFSKHDKNFVMSINLADMFLRDAKFKLAECVKRKNSLESKEVLIKFQDYIANMSKKLLDLNCALLENFTAKDVEQFTKISDRIIENTIKGINGKGM